MQKHQKGEVTKGQKKNKKNKNYVRERERERDPTSPQEACKKRKGRTSEIVTKVKTCTHKPSQQNSTKIQGHIPLDNCAFQIH
jgi:hypothetical protein